MSPIVEMFTPISMVVAKSYLQSRDHGLAAIETIASAPAVSAGVVANLGELYRAHIHQANTLAGGSWNIEIEWAAPIASEYLPWIEEVRDYTDAVCRADEADIKAYMSKWAAEDLPLSVATWIVRESIHLMTLDLISAMKALAIACPQYPSDPTLRDMVLNFPYVKIARG